MDGQGYLKLKKKEDKTDTEWELLKSEGVIRIISELVTDASKRDIEPQYFIDSIRECLKDNDY